MEAGLLVAMANHVFPSREGVRRSGGEEGGGEEGGAEEEGRLPPWGGGEGGGQEEDSYDREYSKVSVV